jgi:hypothetical protein
MLEIFLTEEDILIDEGKNGDSTDGQVQPKA